MSSSLAYLQSESLDLGWLKFLDLHVQCFVDCQSPGLTEALPTLLTFKRLFFGMNIPAGGIKKQTVSAVLRGNHVRFQNIIFCSEWSFGEHLIRQIFTPTLWRDCLLNIFCHFHFPTMLSPYSFLSSPSNNLSSCFHKPISSLSAIFKSHCFCHSACQTYACATLLHPITLSWGTLSAFVNWFHSSILANFLLPLPVSIPWEFHL